MTQPRIKTDVIQNMVVNLILTAAVNLTEQTGTEKEDWVAERITAQVEQFDHLVPALKSYADLPYVDQLEREGIKYVVKFAIRKAYTWAVANRKLPEGNTPASEEPTEEDKKVADALGVPADTILTPAEAASGNIVRPLSAPTENEEGEEGEEPDYATIAEDYSKGGGWYEFPEKEGDGVVKKQGKEEAIAYLKTRDDLVFEEA